jgi:hypothetical protein
MALFGRRRRTKGHSGWRVSFLSLRGPLRVRDSDSETKSPSRQNNPSQPASLPVKFNLKVLEVVNGATASGPCTAPSGTPRWPRRDGEAQAGLLLTEWGVLSHRAPCLAAAAPSPSESTRMAMCALSNAPRESSRATVAAVARQGDLSILFIFASRRPVRVPFWTSLPTWGTILVLPTWGTILVLPTWGIILVLHAHRPDGPFDLHAR